jgi:hypothetical protein
MARLKKHALLFIAISLLAGVALLSVALEFSPVPKEDLPKIKPEARAYYDKALFFLDHVDPEMALGQLEKAVVISPDVLSLDYLLLDLAVRRAAITYGEDSVKYYNIAENAINEILKNPKISDTDRQEAEHQLKIIRSEREKIPERDARREAIGKILIKDKLSLLFHETPTPTPSPVPTVVAPAPTPPTYFYAPPVEAAPAAPPPGSSASPFEVAAPTPGPAPTRRARDQSQETGPGIMIP